MQFLQYEIVLFTKLPEGSVRAEVRVRGGVACAEMLVLKYGEVLLMGRVPVERSQ